MRLTRRQYAELYGPTTGDRFRLADTNLICEIERDLAVPGDEAVFGGGKSIRDGMAQSSAATAAEGALDLVITNVVVLDPLQGVVKADIGVRGGRIAGIGKAGNPDVMDGVDPDLVIGAATEVIAGEGAIATPGGIDTHIHMISPQQVWAALSGGITTLIGGGTGPADGTNATTCTPGPWNIAQMLRAAEALPVPIWVARDWLGGRPARDLVDAEGVALGTEDHAIRQTRPALRWHGLEDDLEASSKIEAERQLAVSGRARNRQHGETKPQKPADQSDS